MAAEGSSSSYVDAPAAVPLVDKCEKDVESECQPPKTKLDEMEQECVALYEKYGHHLSHMRPWREFIKLSKPNNDIQARLCANITYFQINYALVTAVILVGSVLNDGGAIATICLLAFFCNALSARGTSANKKVVQGKCRLYFVLLGIQDNVVKRHLSSCVSHP